MAGSTRPSTRLVLDRNVVVAGLLWNGPPCRLIELGIEGEAIELFGNALLIDELAHTLGYAKLAVRINSYGTSERRGHRLS